LVNFGVDFVAWEWGKKARKSTDLKISQSDDIKGNAKCGFGDLKSGQNSLLLGKVAFWGWFLRVFSAAEGT
jgi:hypothetical protein